MNKFFKIERKLKLRKIAEEKRLAKEKNAKE